VASLRCGHHRAIYAFIDRFPETIICPVCHRGRRITRITRMGSP
jgi:hypothetical protein